MLTGDKGETAKEIGYNCGMFPRDNFEVYMIQDLKELEEVTLKATLNSGVMVPGDLVPQILSAPTEANRFLSIVKKCKCVIVYRSSPSQKADIVKFVRRKIKGSVTLAIGDGGNDVNMI